MDQIRKPQPVPATPVAQVATGHRVAKKSHVKKVIIAAVVVVLLLVAAGVAYKFVLKKDNAGLVGVNEDNYQALFLTNGQVYFGKLEKADKSTIKISDIYYLQVQQAVQPRNEQEQEQQQGETQLVKLGEELHGPQDEMFIDRGQVLFWENLKDNGKVVSAIKEYKKQ